jgi:hypothetical protein
MKHGIWLACLVGCGGSGEGGEPAGATVVGRIQGTEFLEPQPAAAVWLENEAHGLGALRVSDGADGCGAPDGWSLLVQVNLTPEGSHYDLGAMDAEPGKGFLVEYRRDDGSLDMPSEATGTLELVARDDEVIAGSLVLDTSQTATLTAVFEAPVCPAATLIAP